jgi:hypothetical protein
VRSNTYLIDVDGTIFKKTGSTDDWYDGLSSKLLPGVKEFFQRIEKESAHIVLITARKESCRQQLEWQLAHHRIFYDQLIMGVTNGKRIMINDGESELIKVEPNVGLSSSKKLKDAKSVLTSLINITGPLDAIGMVTYCDEQCVVVAHERNGQIVERIDTSVLSDMSHEEALGILEIIARRLRCLV